MSGRVEVVEVQVESPRKSRIGGIRLTGRKTRSWTGRELEEVDGASVVEIGRMVDVRLCILKDRWCGHRCRRRDRRGWMPGGVDEQD